MGGCLTEQLLLTVLGLLLSPLVVFPGVVMALTGMIWQALLTSSG